MSRQPGQTETSAARFLNRKGFSLVELMIVVATIGILAAIAIPNFLQFRLKAKTAEAKSNLGAIRSTEIAYFAEWDYYIGNQPITPTDRTAPGARDDKVAWIADTRFTILGFAPEGDVYFSYLLDGSNIDASNFTARAQSDLDDDGMLADYYVRSNDAEVLKDQDDF